MQTLNDRYRDAVEKLVTTGWEAVIQCKQNLDFARKDAEQYDLVSLAGGVQVSVW